MEDNLATELLRELKRESKRRFILIIVLLFLFFGTNLAWLIAWNLPSESTTESYELQGEDSANVVYNSEGKVSINGNENQSDEENSQENEQTEKP